MQTAGFRYSRIKMEAATKDRGGHRSPNTDIKQLYVVTSVTGICSYKPTVVYVSLSAVVVCSGIYTKFTVFTGRLLLMVVISVCTTSVYL